MIDRIMNGSCGNHLIPFFWLHGEKEETLRSYVKAIHECGCGAVCVESRPHPDFAGPKWWQDLDVIMDACKRHSMKLWVLDDSHFPSGYANGAAEGTPYRRMMITERHMDVIGPMAGGAICVLPDNVKYEPGEGIVAVIAGKRPEGAVADHNSHINVGGVPVSDLVDLTENVKDGMAYWDVPAGTWRVFVITAAYVKERMPPKSFTNPLMREGAQLMIKAVYEPHYQRYKDKFGDTFMGFFSDEPALRAGRGYHAIISKFPQLPLPWRPGMMKLLDEAMGADARVLLPGLWYPIGEKTEKVRYAFMDTVSALYGKNYAGVLGDWCREHGVEYIGHVIEQNNAHARLGSGAGHFFRALWGQDMAGIDVVLHEIIPGFKNGSHAWSSQDFEADDDFFYYMLAQMAVSLAHLDPKKRGRTLCEIFGAYGWQEGLWQMKYLADFMLSRGVNYFVPHAFSPLPYPDPDSPPHLYAQGKNPQYRFMDRLFGYMNRVSDLIDGGRHISQIAALYFAEAEWASAYDCMKTQAVVKALNQRQIECDVVPIDLIDPEKASDGAFVINGMRFSMLVVPWARLWPAKLPETCAVLVRKGVTVVFVNAYPEESSTKAADLPALLAGCKVQTLDELADIAQKTCAYPYRTTGSPDIKLYPYQNGTSAYYLMFNENVRETAQLTIDIDESRTPYRYDPMANRAYPVSFDRSGNSVRLSLSFEPAEMLLIAFSDDIPTLAELAPTGTRRETLSVEWSISLADFGSGRNFSQYAKTSRLFNITAPERLPRFSGTIRYEAQVELEADACQIDLGEAYGAVQVFVNGKEAGVRFSTPYVYDIAGLGQEGTNILSIEVSNTLVYHHRDRLSFFQYIQPTGVLGPVTVFYQQ